MPPGRNDDGRLAIQPLSVEWEFGSVEISGKRLLVIGGAGLIGSQTVDALLATDVAEVRIYDNFVRGRLENIAGALQDPRCNVFAAGGDKLSRDILDAAMGGIDGVFDFAALWLLHCQDYPRSAYEVNVAGTFEVLEAMTRNNVKRLVYSSSASVYGDAVEEPMTEEHPFNFANFYGATKAASESLIRGYYNLMKGTPSAFDYAGLRYMNVYGPRQDYRGAYIAVIMSILDRLDRGLPPVVYGDGSQAYDFVYVGDCAQANIAAMRSDVTDEFFNVGKGKKTTIKELAEMLLLLSGSELDIRYEPAGTTFVKNRIGSTSKARELLEWEAGVELEDGLREVIDWRRIHKGEVESRRQAVQN